MFDLLAVAYQADITRVFTFMMARDLHNRTYPQVGVDEPHHGLSHHQNKPDKIARFAKQCVSRHPAGQVPGQAEGDS